MEQENCQLCLRGITNPICVSCYLKHARLWLRDFGLTEKQVERAMEKIKARMPEETLNEHECVICKNGKLSICMYCAFLKSSPVILKLGNRKHKEAFIESSNFRREMDDTEN